MDEKWTPGVVLRTLAVLCVWAIWLPLSGARALLRLATEFLNAHYRWIRRALWAVPGTILLVGMIQLVPLVYGRFALLNEADHQARTSAGREPAELDWALRRSAFRHGFKDVIHQEAAFSIESDTDSEGEPLCVVNISVEQKLNLLGCCPLVFHVRKRVVSPVTPTDFKRKKQEERISVE
jgi:hypothetical protein